MRALSRARKVLIEPAAFAALAYWGARVVADAPIAAGVLAVLVATSTTLLTALDQWAG
jgi:hypothetical protein